MKLILVITPNDNGIQTTLEASGEDAIERIREELDRIQSPLLRATEVKLWTTASGVEILRMVGTDSIAFRADGHMIIMAARRWHWLGRLRTCLDKIMDQDP